ncbi:MAG: methyltransferase domain-containing protein [Candidatus Aminicenantes bacterium]|nr:methyltransferase domain-containing protein [Candidatus Aminicenantes bacterium]
MVKPPEEAPPSHLDGLLSGHLKRRRLGMLLPFIPAGSRILDVGCGDGALLALLPAVSRYLGVDSRADLVRHNQRRLGRENVSFIRADFPALEWSGPPFDRVVLAAVLEHLDGLEPVLDRLRPLVGEGGLLLITTPAPFSRFVLQAGALFRLFARDSLAEHQRYYRRNDFHHRPEWRLERYRRFEFGLNQLLVLRRLRTEP